MVKVFDGDSHCDVGADAVALQTIVVVTINADIAKQKPNRTLSCLVGMF